jgi:hypothetical protein
VLLRAYPKNDIVLELVILNGAKRSEVSHNMPAGDFTLFYRFFTLLRRVVEGCARKMTKRLNSSTPILLSKLKQSIAF